MPKKPDETFVDFVVRMAGKWLAGPADVADLINKPIEELISQAVNLPIWRRTHRQDLPSFVRTRGGVS